MAQDEGFKLIQVTAPEDEDVIIHAGVSDAPFGDASAIQTEDAIGNDSAVQDEPAADGGSATRTKTAPGRSTAQADPLIDGTPVEAAVEAPTPALVNAEEGQSPKATRKALAKPQAGYHETTLEDLQDTSMPLAQRIVIIAAVVCIIGALIYCCFFMR